jgi:hypothetical protein
VPALICRLTRRLVLMLLVLMLLVLMLLVLMLLVKVPGDLAHPRAPLLRRPASLLGSRALSQYDLICQVIPRICNDGEAGLIRP